MQRGTQDSEQARGTSKHTNKHKGTNSHTKQNTNKRTLGQDKLWGSGRAVEGAVAGRGNPPVGPRPSLMTTVFAGLGGGEGVGASGGRGWPKGGGGPGSPPGAGVRDAAACRSSGGHVHSGMTGELA